MMGTYINLLVFLLPHFMPQLAALCKTSKRTIRNA